MQTWHLPPLAGQMLACIVSLTVYVTLDIEYPRLGFVRIDAIDPLPVAVRAGMECGVGAKIRIDG